MHDFQATPREEIGLSRIPFVPPVPERPDITGDAVGSGPAAEITNVRVTRDGQPQNEPSVAVSLWNPRVIIVTANDFREGDTRVGLYRSTDGGGSFSPRMLPLPEGFGTTGDAVVDFGFSRRFLVAALALNRTAAGARDGSIVVYRSSDHGRTFAEPVTVNRGFGTCVFLDKPALAIDKSEQSPFDGQAYVSYTAFLDDFRAAVVAVQRSEDGGRSWSVPVELTAPGERAGGSSVTVGRFGDVYVSWIHVQSLTRARFRMRRSEDGGVTFGPAVTVAEVSLVPHCVPRPGVPCLPVPGWRFRTPTYSSLAADISGGPDTLYALWQDFRSGAAEILLARSRDGGDTWSGPVGVSGGAQAFLPNIAVSPETGDVQVVYYSNRLSPPPGTLLDVFVAEAPPGGRSFERRRITDRSFNPNADPSFGEPSRFIGDYIGIAALPPDGFVAVWTDTRTGSQKIFAGTW